MLKNQPKWYRCPKCDNTVFDLLYMVTKLSKIEYPELPEDQLASVPVYVCANPECGEMISVQEILNSDQFNPTIQPVQSTKLA